MTINCIIVWVFSIKITDLLSSFSKSKIIIECILIQWTIKSKLFIYCTKAIQMLIETRNGFESKINHWAEYIYIYMQTQTACISKNSYDIFSWSRFFKTFCGRSVKENSWENQKFQCAKSEKFCDTFFIKTEEYCKIFWIMGNFILFAKPWNFQNVSKLFV